MPVDSVPTEIEVYARACNLDALQLTVRVLRLGCHAHKVSAQQCHNPE
jgi:hypothetical protein